MRQVIFLYIFSLKYFFIKLVEKQENLVYYILYYLI